MVGTGNLSLKLPVSTIPRVASMRSENSPWSRMTDPQENDDEEATISESYDQAPDESNAPPSEVQEAMVSVEFNIPVDYTSPTSLPERTAKGAGSGSGHCTIVVPPEGGNGEHKVLRGMSSRMSRHSLKTFVSGAFDEAFQGLEPLSMFLMRLIVHHRCLIFASFFMVGIGVFGGVVIEEWDFLTALYVIVQIITTIGYGDVTVDKEWMKLFMTAYVLLSLVFVANFLNIFLTCIIERHAETLHRSLLSFEVAADSGLDTVREARQRFGRYNEVIVSGFFFVTSIMIGTFFFKYAEDCSCSYGETRQDDCIDSTYDRCVETGGHIHTWITAFYMSVITVTTVGFGDYSPKTRPGRVFGLCWMTLGVAATAFFIASVSKIVAKEPGTEISGADDIDEDLFAEMDQDGNGWLSKDEYMRYVLVRHGFVDKAVLRDIDEKYDFMNVPMQGRKSTKGVNYDMIKTVQTKTTQLEEQS